MSKVIFSVTDKQADALRRAKERGRLHVEPRTLKGLMERGLIKAVGDFGDCSVTPSGIAVLALLDSLASPEGQA